eukprot:5219599-Pleurochrysis_carterae.AAC.2
MEGTVPVLHVIHDAVMSMGAKAAKARGGGGGGGIDGFKEKYLGTPAAMFASEYKSVDQYMKKLGSAADAKAAWFQKVQAQVRPDLLRQGVAALSVGAEAYLAKRAAFAHSLAVLTIAGYVLGIGDRHLENFMLERESGRVVGIDFGHAFGTATSTLPVPELMAVRLTQQMTCFLRPLDGCVLLKGFMAHVLRALRARKADMMRVLE